MRIAFIGGGVMAQAIIAGVKDAGLDASIIVGEPFEVRRESLKNDLGVEATADNKEAVTGADIVVLSVKPQQLDAIADDLKSTLKASQARPQEADPSYAEHTCPDSQGNFCVDGVGRCRSGDARFRCQHAEGDRR